MNTIINKIAAHDEEYIIRCKEMRELRNKIWGIVTNRKYEELTVEYKNYLMEIFDRYYMYSDDSSVYNKHLSIEQALEWCNKNRPEWEGDLSTINFNDKFEPLHIPEFEEAGFILPIYFYQNLRLVPIRNDDDLYTYIRLLMSYETIETYLTSNMMYRNSYLALESTGIGEEMHNVAYLKLPLNVVEAVDTFKESFIKLIDYSLELTSVHNIRKERLKVVGRVGKSTVDDFSIMGVPITTSYYVAL